MQGQETGSGVGARGVSFENRIAITALVTAVVVLVTASILFIVEQWQSGQVDLRRHEAALTEIMAGEIAPAQARGDLGAEQKMLAQLVAAPEVRSADLFDAQGRRLLHVDGPPGTGLKTNRFFDTARPS